MILLKTYLFQKETQKYLSLTILLIAFSLFLPIKSYSQTHKHLFFGVDLDSDWRSLTNQQYLAYWLQDQDTSSKFVIIDCDYIKDKIESKFLNLGFLELLVIFPKGCNQRSVDSLRPELFLARISYTDIDDYTTKSDNDIRKIQTLLIEKYDEPELNMIKDKYSVYKWEGINYQIILTCREDELSTTLIYTKQ
jgi:hypothetical protein